MKRAVNHDHGWPDEQPDWTDRLVSMTRVRSMVRNAAALGMLVGFVVGLITMWPK